MIGNDLKELGLGRVRRVGELYRSGEVDDPLFMMLLVEKIKKWRFFFTVLCFDFLGFFLKRHFVLMDGWTYGWTDG